MEEDHQCTRFFWESSSHEEGVTEEFRQALLYARLELETAVGSAKEEIARRDSELVRLKDRISRIIGERDEARSRSQNLQLENLVLRQQLSQNQDSPTHQCPSSACPEETAIRDGTQTWSPSPQKAVDIEELAGERPLPEKGKLLQAVIDAGPTLETLMLAGQLPQWQRPPPQLDSDQIPPVAAIPNKRGIGASSTSPKNKCMKMIS